MALRLQIGGSKVSIGSGGKDTSSRILNTVGDSAKRYGNDLKNNFSQAGKDWGENWQKVGKWSTNAWNNVTGKNSREANEQAAREAERARRDSIVKQFGARQQADNLAYGGLQRNSGGGSSNAPGVVGQSDMPGSIGANLSLSGTF